MKPLACTQLQNTCMINRERFGSLIIKESGPISEMAIMVFHALGSKKNKFNLDFETIVTSQTEEIGVLFLRVMLQTDIGSAWVVFRKAPH